MMVNFAIFGAGFIGQVHANNIYNHPRAALRYVYDVNHEAAAKFNERFGAQVVTSPDAIWNAPDIEAVLIASSTNTHADLLNAAIDAGKPVFCEKPIDLDIERVNDVARKAKGKDLLIVLGFSRRFDADYSELQARFRHGEIGKLEMLHLTSRGPTPPPISYVKVSGGQLRDQTIHFFDLAAWIANELPTEVYAAGRVWSIRLSVRQVILTPPCLRSRCQVAPFVKSITADVRPMVMTNGLRCSGRAACWKLVASRCQMSASIGRA
jgi:myo-inositol 2-dehydrogenase/D-chiro-inositol 1-dehydrogenase